MVTAPKTLQTGKTSPETGNREPQGRHSLPSNRTREFPTGPRWFKTWIPAAFRILSPAFVLEAQRSGVDSRASTCR